MYTTYRCQVRAEDMWLCAVLLVPCASSALSRKPHDTARCKKAFAAHRRTSHIAQGYKATKAQGNHAKATRLPTVRLTVSPPVAEFFLCDKSSPSIIISLIFVVHAGMHFKSASACARERTTEGEREFLNFLLTYLLSLNHCPCFSVLRNKANSMICIVILPFDLSGS